MIAAVSGKRAVALATVAPAKGGNQHTAKDASRPQGGKQTRGTERLRAIAERAAGRRKRPSSRWFEHPRFSGVLPTPYFLASRVVRPASAQTAPKEPNGKAGMAHEKRLRAIAERAPEAVRELYHGFMAKAVAVGVAGSPETVDADIAEKCEVGLHQARRHAVALSKSRVDDRRFAQLAEVLDGLIIALFYADDPKALDGAVAWARTKQAKSKITFGPRGKTLQQWAIEAHDALVKSPGVDPKLTLAEVFGVSPDDIKLPRTKRTFVELVRGALRGLSVPAEKVANVFASSRNASLRERRRKNP